MKEKQKQIDEMARIMKEVKYEPFNDGVPTYTVGNQMQDFVFDLIGEALYNAGYRKIPEGAVVLTGTKELQQFEWSKMLDKMGFFKFADNLRKETAEKFAEMAKSKAHPAYVNIDDKPRKDSFVLLSDIDEICKEITEGKV